MEKILSNVDPVSNLPHPRVKLKQQNSQDTPQPTPGHTHTRTPNNERIYQELKRRERHTHTTNSETERKSETEKENTCHTRVSQQTLDPIHNPSKVKGPPPSRGRGEKERGVGGEKKSSPLSTTNACSPVGKRNTFWVGDCCRNSVPVVLFICK